MTIKIFSTEFCKPRPQIATGKVMVGGRFITNLKYELNSTLQSGELSTPVDLCRAVFKFLLLCVICPSQDCLCCPQIQLQQKDRRGMIIREDST